MNPYIMSNTKLRIAAKNGFRKTVLSLWILTHYPLISRYTPSVCVTVENITNHKDMKLVKSQEKYGKYEMKPNFKYGYPFSKQLFPVEVGKKEIKMNKLVYLGQAILVPSKTLMHQFHYDYMLWKYGRKRDRRLLERHCKRCRDKVWYKWVFKGW